MSRVRGFVTVALFMTAYAVAQPPQDLVAQTSSGVSGSSWDAASTGDSSYVCWFESGLRFSRSVDGGETWSGAVTIAPDGAEPTMLVRGASIAIVYMGAGPLSDVLLVESSDGGASWSPPETVSAGGASDRSQPVACRSGLVICVAWREGAAVKFNRRGALGWLPSDVTVTTDAAANHRIAVRALDVVVGLPPSFASTALVSWRSLTGSDATIGHCPDVLPFASSPPVLPAFTEVTMPGVSNTAEWVDSAVVAGPAGAEYHVMWSDAGAIRVASCSGDPTDPTQWQAVVAAPSGQDPVAEPSLLVTQGSVFVPPRVVVAYTQSDRVFVTSGVLADGGVAFEGPVAVSPASGSAQARHPRLSGYREQVFCCWHAAAGDHQLILNRSLDGGQSWLLPQEAILVGSEADVGSGASASRAYEVIGNEGSVGPGGGAARLIWSRSSGTPEQTGMYATHLFGSRAYGAGTGALGATLSASDPSVPLIGNTMKLKLSLTAGGNAIGIWLYGSGRGPLDLGVLDGRCSGTPVMISTIDIWPPPLFVTTLGQATLVVPLPLTSSLVGYRVNLTAVLLNGSATACGWDVANGIEVFVL